MAIEQWVSFSGASVYNVHLREPVTVTTCFYDLCLSRLGFEQPTFSLQGERSNPNASPPLFIFQYSSQCVRIRWMQQKLDADNFLQQVSNMEHIDAWVKEVT